ncbi:MAG: rhomboid family intramembrane serine protease [Bacteroidetes bacterium]|nr:rhomboid family intramembrane serine protease [Bacteroidota bacterium]
MLQQLPAATRNLLILIGITGIAQFVLPRNGWNTYTLYLFYPDSNLFRPWQLVTHMFCHGGLMHFLFNAIALFSFGSIVEYKIGTKRFVYLFLISGLGAVAVHYASVAVEAWQLTGSVLPYRLGVVPHPIGYAETFLMAGTGAVHYGPMLGASGALYGIMAAFAFLYPNERMIFLFIPYPIKAKYLVPIIVGIDILFGFGRVEGDPMAHFAHIGGALTGFLIVKLWFSNWLRSRRY